MEPNETEMFLYRKRHYQSQEEATYRTGSKSLSIFIVLKRNIVDTPLKKTVLGLQVVQQLRHLLLSQLT